MASEARAFAAEIFPAMESRCFARSVSALFWVPRYFSSLSSTVDFTPLKAFLIAVVSE